MSKRYKFKKKYTWTENLAYIVGLITTDGCLSSDGRHIDFTSKDYQLVSTYRNILNPDLKIGIKKNGMGIESFRVQIGDVALYDFFLELGLTPRKSKILSILKIPEQYYADFLRGCFDGDGTVYSFWDVRWKSSYMYYLNFASASKPFLDWLHLENTRIIRLTGGVVKAEASSAYCLCYAKINARKLSNFMYYKEDLPRLERKYKKLQEIFTIDPTFIRTSGLRNNQGRVLESGRQATLRT